MESIVAVLADKQQALVGTIGITGMSTHRASLARGVGIDPNDHRIVQERFIGNHALQLGKAPLGVGSVRSTLLPTGLLAMFATGPFADICQAFQYR